MKEYRKPLLRRLGRVEDMTQGATNTGNDNATFEVPPAS